jgi:hypothetical protein
VFYQGTLKWNQGVHNTMTYNIPSGTYDNTRLANLSFGWVAVDGGAGYTYFDPKTGHEFSIVGGQIDGRISPPGHPRRRSEPREMSDLSP